MAVQVSRKSSGSGLSRQTKERIRGIVVHILLIHAAIVFLMPFLARTSREDLTRLRQRVAGELTTTFASHYTDEISLREAIDVETLQRYARQATGQKFLIRPQR